jgi:hypothetical protein
LCAPASMDQPVWPVVPSPVTVVVVAGAAVVSVVKWTMVDMFGARVRVVGSMVRCCSSLLVVRSAVADGVLRSGTYD